MKYRFNEDKILNEVSKYIAATYKAHYVNEKAGTKDEDCLLYTSPSPRDAHESRMPSSA